MFSLTVARSSYSHGGPFLTFGVWGFRLSPRSYLFISVLFTDAHEMMDKVGEIVGQDIKSDKQLDCCLALHCVANIGGKVLAEAVGPVLGKLFKAKETPPFVKKKVALALLKLLREGSVQYLAKPEYVKAMSQVNGYFDLALSGDSVSKRWLASGMLVACSCVCSCAFCVCVCGVRCCNAQSMEYSPLQPRWRLHSVCGTRKSTSRASPMSSPCCTVLFSRGSTMTSTSK